MNIEDLSSKRIDLVDLVKIGKDGLADMHEYSIMPEFYEYLSYEPFETIEETSSYIDKLINRSNSETGHYWYIRLKSKKIIGTFCLINIDLKSMSSEIGYGISPDYWGMGYFKESLLMVLNYLFLKLNFNRVWAKTESNNSSSINGLVKCGFKIDEVKNDFYISSNHQYRDATFLSLNQKDFYRISLND